jgi:RNA polymerase sigma factor (sigma-70 family)
VIDAGGEEVWRSEAPHVLAALLRRDGDFAACEDAVQEALLAASRQWQIDGVPDRPRAWLIRVAARRLIDHRRSDVARRRREERVTAEPMAAEVAGAARDDALDLLILCAHPSLRPVSQVALTLRVVAGLTTAQIAAAFLVPESTMAQRISRAKATITAEGGRMPGPRRGDVGARLHAVRHVLYLAFNEGHTASSGDTLIDVDLADEAIRLTELLHRSVPSDTETAGLLALMLLTHARTPARLDDAGDLVPLAEQDRTQWVPWMIARGVRLIEEALPSGPVGPFQLQAAIAAVHAEASVASATDWAQIVELYRMLSGVAPSSVVSLNLAVAIGMAEGARAGLDALAPLVDDPTQQRNHRLWSARGHLLAMAGDPDAGEAFCRAASLATSIPEQRYLNRRGQQAPT